MALQRAPSQFESYPKRQNECLYSCNYCCLVISPLVAALIASLVIARCLVVDVGVIVGAKLLPIRRGDVLRRHIRDILRKDNSKASIQVPIDVAMEEPRSRIVREEPDCHFIPSVTNTHDISDHRVVEVVRRVASAPDYMEVMPM